MKHTAVNSRVGKRQLRVRNYSRNSTNPRLVHASYLRLASSNFLPPHHRICKIQPPRMPPSSKTRRAHWPVGRLIWKLDSDRRDGSESFEAADVNRMCDMLREIATWASTFQLPAIVPGPTLAAEASPHEDPTKWERKHNQTLIELVL
jgi:hypothetical protein